LVLRCLYSTEKQKVYGDPSRMNAEGEDQADTNTWSVS
jgi:hypothetical protein